MGASGHIIAYLIGSLELVSFLPGWVGGDTQFKKMCVVAAFAVCTAVGLTSWAVNERVLLSSGEAEPIRKTLLNLWSRMRDLPPRIQAICNVQFWSWIGWFPFLFYGSTWVGMLALRRPPDTCADMTQARLTFDTNTTKHEMVRSMMYSAKLVDLGRRL
jgi:solute carrier family 45 protein 1/2/4